MTGHSPEVLRGVLDEIPQGTDHTHFEMRDGSKVRGEYRGRENNYFFVAGPEVEKHSIFEIKDVFIEGVSDGPE